MNRKPICLQVNSVYNFTTTNHLEIFLSQRAQNYFQENKKVKIVPFKDIDSI